MINYSDIEKACMQFDKKTGLVVSKNAKELIYNIFRAIIEDPHPQWKEDSYERENIADDLFENVVYNLVKISETEKETTKITFFAVMHWMSTNLDRICPIQK